MRHDTHFYYYYYYYYRYYFYYYCYYYRVEAESDRTLCTLLAQSTVGMGEMRARTLFCSRTCRKAAKFTRRKIETNVKCLSRSCWGNGRDPEVDSRRTCSL